jgi:putative transposase
LLDERGLAVKVDKVCIKYRQQALVRRRRTLAELIVQASTELLKRGACEDVATARTKPEFDCVFRTLGKIGERGVLSKLILFGERSLRRAMKEYVAHHHAERNHQGKSNVLLFPQVTETHCDKAVECRERLGGLLRYYHRDAA